MKRKILLLIVLLSAVVMLLLLQYRALQTPGVQERLLSDIRDTPAIVFWPIYVGVVVLGLGPALYILFGHNRWARRATAVSVHLAKRVALSLWYVESPRVIDACPVIQFRHVSFSNWAFVLPVRPGHPDIEKFRKLRDGDKVEFEPLEKCMECALEHELCGYLRIKSVR